MDMGRADYSGAPCSGSVSAGERRIFVALQSSRRAVQFIATSTCVHDALGISEYGFCRAILGTNGHGEVGTLLCVLGEAKAVASIDG